MDENKKEYSVVGTVTIRTDEYRDLLTEKFEADKAISKLERECKHWHDKWYQEYRTKGKLESEYTKLKEELDKLRKFVSENTAVIDENGITMSLINEGGVTVFRSSVSLFEEK